MPASRSRSPPWGRRSTGCSVAGSPSRVEDVDVRGLRDVAPPRLRPAVGGVGQHRLEVLPWVRPRAARLRGDAVQVVRERRPQRGGEEVVVQHEVVCPAEIVAGILRPELCVRGVAVHHVVEPIHRPIVDRLDRALAAVRDIERASARGRQEGHPLAVLHPEAHAMGAREPAKEVVEAPVLLDQEDHVLDRRLRVECVGVDRSGQRHAHPRPRPVDLEWGRRRRRHGRVVVHGAGDGDHGDRDDGESEPNGASRTGRRTPGHYLSASASDIRAA